MVEEDVVKGRKTANSVPTANRSVSNKVMVVRWEGARGHDHTHVLGSMEGKV